MPDSSPNILDVFVAGLVAIEALLALSQPSFQAYPINSNNSNA